MSLERTLTHRQMHTVTHTSPHTHIHTDEYHKYIVCVRPVAGVVSGLINQQLGHFKTLNISPNVTFDDIYNSTVKWLSSIATCSISLETMMKRRWRWRWSRNRPDPRVCEAVPCFFPHDSQSDVPKNNESNGKKLKQLFGVRKNMASLLLLLLGQPRHLLSGWS